MYKTNVVRETPASVRTPVKASGIPTEQGSSTIVIIAAKNIMLVARAIVPFFESAKTSWTLLVAFMANLLFEDSQVGPYLKNLQNSLKK